MIKEKVIKVSKSFYRLVRGLKENKQLEGKLKTHMPTSAIAAKWKEHFHGLNVVLLLFNQFLTISYCM